MSKKLSKTNPDILIGKKADDGLLKLSNCESVFVYAPTNSGYGVSVINPNLLSYPDSVVLLDIEQQKWDLTAGYRSGFSECILFAPTFAAGRSACWNPLDYIGSDEISQVFGISLISECLYPKNDKDAFFTDKARRLFEGLVLFLLESPNRSASIPELLRVLDPVGGLPFNEWFIEECNRRNRNQMDSDEPPLSWQCSSLILAYCTKFDDKIRENIKQTLLAPLAAFSDPLVASCTSTSTFRLDEVRKKKMSIYVSVGRKDYDQLRDLLTLFFSQLLFLNSIESHDENPDYINQCLVVIDDHINLNKLNTLPSLISMSEFNLETLSAFNMRLMIRVKNLVSLKKDCGQKNVSNFINKTAWIYLDADPILKTPFLESDVLLFCPDPDEQIELKRIVSFSDPLFENRRNLKRVATVSG